MPFSPRPLPSETVDGLSPPHRGFGYFQSAGDMPFEPDEEAYCSANAWWLAEASLLVYEDQATVTTVVRNSPLAQQGYQLEWLGSAENNRGMVLRNDQALIVIFRGTRIELHSLQDVAEITLLQQDDLLIDSQFLPTGYEKGGQVHSGFLKAFKEVRGQLDELVRNRKPGQALWLTGHSLGGALATLSASHVSRQAVQGLYTYGSPRVGDAAFVSLLPTQSHYRLVHRDDWFPNTPPELLGYVHGGTLKPVLGTKPRDQWGDFVQAANGMAAALTAMAREGKLLSRDLPFNLGGLADHMPIYYATLLYNALGLHK